MEVEVVYRFMSNCVCSVLFVYICWVLTEIVFGEGISVMFYDIFISKLIDYVNQEF